MPTITPAGLPTWGDTRLTVLGAQGYMEVRKNVDIAGKPGADHLFLVDAKGVQRIDCASVDLPYGRQVVDDVLDEDGLVVELGREGASNLADEIESRAKARLGEIPADTALLDELLLGLKGRVARFAGN